MAKFGYKEFKNKEECNPTEVNKMCIMRGDNAFIETKKDLLDVCTKCDNVTACTEWIKQIKSQFFSELNK